MKNIADINKKYGATIIFVALLIGGYLLFKPRVLEVDIDKADSIVSDFNAGNTGWTVIGDKGQDLKVPAYKTDNNGNGYLEADDKATGGVWYWNAPKSYLGKKSQFYKGVLLFDLYQQSAIQNQFHEIDIMLIGENMKLINKFPYYPRKNWTHYTFKLEENSGWRVDTKNGKMASVEEIKNVLKNLTGMQIRGEFEAGIDKGGLDNVRLSKPAS